jgi:hypothetical protein
MKTEEERFRVRGLGRRKKNKVNLMSLAGFQRWMEPSARPPAMTPRGNSSKLPTPKVPHDKRLKRSTVTHELSTGRSNSVLAKSSFSNSKFADELKLRSMAPAIVPTAIICAIGANATVADLCIDFNAILFSSSSSSLYLSFSLSFSVSLLHLLSRICAHTRIGPTSHMQSSDCLPLHGKGCNLIPILENYSNPILKTKDETSRS